MVATVKALLLVSVLAAFALAGCVESDAPDVDLPDSGTDAALEDGVLTADSSVPAPSWNVGQYFGHHIFFGAGDSQGEHINTVVVGNEGSNYRLLTDNKEIATFEATFDLPLLGDISKTDLSTTSFGGPFGGYAFPLTDGKSWQSQITVEFTQTFDPLTRDVTVTSTFNPAIEMPGSSKTEPGFDLVAMHEGEVLYESNYVPAIGWYASLRYYDLTTEDPDDYIFFVRSMGYGDDFAKSIGGVVYDITGIQHVDWIQIDVAPEGTGSLHREEFMVSEAATDLIGIQFSFAAVAGQSSSQLIDPDGNRYGYQAVAEPNGADPTAWGGGDGTDGEPFESYPLVVGEWQYIQENAGFASGGGAFIWELQEEQIIL